VRSTTELRTEHIKELGNQVLQNILRRDSETIGIGETKFTWTGGDSDEAVVAVLILGGLGEPMT
jgi:hypothetical protein